MPISNGANLVKLTRVVAWALCAAPLLMAADARRPRAAAPNESDSPPADSRLSDDDSAKSAFEKQWAQAQGWMQEHCPRRYHFVETLRAGGSFQQQARRQMIDGYNRIQKIPYVPMREAMTVEFEAQDQVFGAQWELRQARRRSDASLQNKADADLRVAVSHLFDAQQNMKRVQLKRHQDEIKRLQSELELQERRRTQVVDNWYRNMKNRADTATGGTPPGPNGRTQNAAPNDKQRPAQEQE